MSLAQAFVCVRRSIGLCRGVFLGGLLFQAKDQLFYEMQFTVLQLLIHLPEVGTYCRVQWNLGSTAIPLLVTLPRILDC